MPMPSVLPMPPLPARLSRFSVPEEAQEASYFAASARISSLRRSSMAVTHLLRSIYVLLPGEFQPRQPWSVPATTTTRSQPMRQFLATASLCLALFGAAGYAAGQGAATGPGMDRLEPGQLIADQIRIVLRARGY